jgi:16S rRNA (guanine966-N2)-methyltransferase
MPNKLSKIKIIAGRFKSRNIEFIDNPNQQLRPTPARLRETLFNWLMHDIQDSICIDLFAGSGILGFEALSRGAKAVIAFEIDKKISKTIKSNCQKLDIPKSEYQLFNKSSLDFISFLDNLDSLDKLNNSDNSENPENSSKSNYSNKNKNQINSLSNINKSSAKNIIIFCDPPFNTDVFNKILKYLASSKNISLFKNKSIYLYLEYPKKLDLEKLNKIDNVNKNREGRENIEAKEFKEFKDVIEKIEASWEFSKKSVCGDVVGELGLTRIA